MVCTKREKENIIKKQKRGGVTIVKGNEEVKNVKNLSELGKNNRGIISCPP
jgi:hypothetical protein